MYTYRGAGGKAGNLKVNVENGGRGFGFARFHLMITFCDNSVNTMRKYALISRNEDKGPHLNIGCNLYRIIFHFIWLRISFILEFLLISSLVLYSVIRKRIIDQRTLRRGKKERNPRRGRMLFWLLISAIL